MNKLFAFVIPAMLSLSLNASAGNKALLADSNYTIKVKNMSMVVNAVIGGRITSLKLGDTEILSGKKIHANFYGSTIWLSPEGKWRGQGVTDNKDYKVDKYTNNSNLHITSQNDSLRGFAMVKEFTANAKDTSISMKYSITNIAKAMQSVSAWEVTRVIPGGLEFYPKGETPALPKTNLPIKEEGGVIWYAYDPSTVNFQKAYQSGSEGWQAYVRNGIIFIKQFPTVKTTEFAPGEVNVEVYVNKEKTYMEIENQGPFTELQHGQTLTFDVKWYVRQIPANIKADVGSQALVNYVRSVLKIKK